jgi:hypothetical protein
VQRPRQPTHLTYEDDVREPVKAAPGMGVPAMKKNMRTE